MAQINFDPTKVQPAASMEPVPPAWYAMTLIESGWKETSDPSNDNAYLLFVFQIDADQHPDVGARKIWMNFNLKNNNAKSVEIAASQLAQFYNAASSGAVDDTEQLHGIPVAAKVVIRPAKDGYEARNEIKEFDMHSARFSGATAPKPAAKPAAAPAKDAPQGGSMPAWMTPK